MAAVADGSITDAERRDFTRVARLLGQQKCDLDEILREATANVSQAQRDRAAISATEASLVGMRVCFTGELQCQRGGQRISRELAKELATRAGLIVVDSVTKKLDLLVVADPQSQSSKAKKARQYGTRSMHELIFWKAINVNVE